MDVALWRSRTVTNIDFALEELYKLLARKGYTFPRKKLKCLVYSQTLNGLEPKSIEVNLELSSSFYKNVFLFLFFSCSGKQP